MDPALACIRTMSYPGRLIIIGLSPSGQQVALYAVTGRSPSSQARRLKIDSARQCIVIRPTDETILRTGNPTLLVYPAIMWGTRGVAISNGTQTEAVFEHLAPDRTPVEVLVRSLRDWHYEPDEPNFTPRISGCITKDGAALSIIKRAPDGSSMRAFFEVPMIRGSGKMIATYTGMHRDPLPSFIGEPYDIAIPWDSPQAAAQAFYDALGPQAGNPDVRVATAAVFSRETVAVHVHNRYA
ncbi:MAG: IMP cyclohydrolase [Desulfobacterota bacterium]|nr:IMP cyclohydrolase [Thermodesulfobacteriota bacterium]